jgi:hypothetical protein
MAQALNAEWLSVNAPMSISSTSPEGAKIDMGTDITARLNAEEAAIGPENPGPTDGVVT